MEKTVLVTGGAGYIGSHTVRVLHKAGYTPIVYDNLSSGHKKAIDGYKLVLGELGDRETLENAFKKHQPEAVIHFAGYIEAGESVTDPQRFFHNNLIAGINLLDVMVSNNVKKIVFSSSAAVYGEPQRIPIDEEDEKIPTNPYGLTKLMFEQTLRAYDRAYGIKSVSLRYFNAAGADPSGEIGADHRHKTHLITVAILTALGVNKELRLYGSDYPTGDGTCIRDYIHVNDLADAHILALKYLEKNKQSNYFNLGNEKGTSVKEIIEKTKGITGKNFCVKNKERREGDPGKVVASSVKARNILEWKPKFPDIDTILKTAYGWHKNNPKGYGDNKR